MKSLIQRLIDDEKISNNHAEGIEEFSLKKEEMLITWNKTFGSNYVPAEIMMSMREEKNNREVIRVI